MIIHKFTEERPEKASLFAWWMRFLVFAMTWSTLTIIRVIHSPKFGYLVLHLLLFRLSNWPDFARLPVRRTIQKVSSDTNVKKIHENVKFQLLFTGNIPRGVLPWIWQNPETYGAKSHHRRWFGMDFDQVAVNGVNSNKFHAISVQINTIYWHEM